MKIKLENGTEIEVEILDDAIRIPMAVGHRVNVKELKGYEAEEFSGLQRLFGKSNFGEHRKAGLTGVVKQASPHAEFWMVKHDDEKHTSEWSVYHVSELEDMTARDIVAGALSAPLYNWLEGNE